MPLDDFRLKLLLGCLLLGLYLLVYTPTLNAIDAEAILAVATGTLRHGAPDIGVIGASDALLPFDKARMGSFGADGALYSKKGPTPSLALLPLALLAQALPWLDARAAAMLFNPLVTMAAAITLYALARRLDYRPRTAFVVGLLFGAGTFAIVYVKTLYGEPLAAWLLLTAVLAAVYYRQTAGPRWLLVSGGALGLLVGVNLIYALFPPLLALYMFGWSPRPRPALLLAAPILLALALLALYNWARFGSPTQTGYYFASGEGFTTPLGRGLPGLTISPFRGLFWYNPLLLLALPGWLALRRRAGGLAWLLLALAAVQTLVFSLWSSWEGGVVWGPRFLLTVTPLLTLLLAPLVEAAWSQRGLLLVIAGLALLSVGVQALGALYSLYPFNAWLFAGYYNPAADAFADEVLVNPGLSAIVGHLALAAVGWPLEPAWAARGLDAAVLAAALALVAAGVAASRWLRSSRRALLLTLATGAVCLNITAARQQTGPAFEQIQALGAALQPPGTVVAATTHFGEALLDLDAGGWILSTNAPTQPGDRLAAPMWDFARGRGGLLWLVTWFEPGSPHNWQERDLWRTAAFALERQAAGHRLLLFSQEPAPEADCPVGARFGPLRLERIGRRATPSGLFVTAAWSAVEPAAADYAWFIHLVNPDGSIAAQQDRAPQGGYAPTSGWQPDEIVLDRLFFPAAASAGLRLRVGFINPADGARLPAFAADGAPLADGYILLPLEPGGAS